MLECGGKEPFYTVGGNVNWYSQYGEQYQFSCVRLFATPWTAARQASLSITNFQVYPNSCPLSQWCHPTISSSVVPFASCLQSFPASESFQMSQLFASGGQSIGISASTSVLPMDTQDWSPLGWTGWISLQSKGLSRVWSVKKLKKLKTQLWYDSAIPLLGMDLEKNIIKRLNAPQCSLQHCLW